VRNFFQLLAALDFVSGWMGLDFTGVWWSPIVLLFIARLFPKSKGYVALPEGCPGGWCFGSFNPWWGVAFKLGPLGYFPVVNLFFVTFTGFYTTIEGGAFFSIPIILWHTWFVQHGHRIGWNSHLKHQNNDPLDYHKRQTAWRNNAGIWFFYIVIAVIAYGLGEEAGLS